MATNPSITITGSLQNVDQGAELLKGLLANSPQHLFLDADQVQLLMTFDDELLVFTLDPVEIRITGPAPSSDGGE